MVSEEDENLEELSVADDGWEALAQIRLQNFLPTVLKQARGPSESN